jgi:hypothetical protein
MGCQKGDAVAPPGKPMLRLTIREPVESVDQEIGVEVENCYQWCHSGVHGSPPGLHFRVFG